MMHSELLIVTRILASCVLPLLVTTGTASIINVSNSDVEYFSNIVNKWAPICSNPTNNEVLSRNDKVNDNRQTIREWSLLHSDINYLASSKGHDKKHWCLTTTQIKSAISLPIREQPCILKWYTQNDICRLMQHYSVVIWNGDSLTRHMTQALFMLWTEDFRYGGFPRHSNIKEDLFDFCGCDGQFSESLLCRSYIVENLKFEDARSVGLCSLLDPFDSPRFYYQYVHKDDDHYNLEQVKRICSNEPGLRFIFLQGGTHYLTNATTTISEYIRPSLNRLVNTIEFIIQSCLLSISLFNF
jgi:hypothetical protein